MGLLQILDKWLLLLQQLDSRKLKQLFHSAFVSLFVAKSSDGLKITLGEMPPSFLELQRLREPLNVMRYVIDIHVLHMVVFRIKSYLGIVK